MATCACACACACVAKRSTCWNLSINSAQHRRVLEDESTQQHNVRHTQATGCACTEQESKREENATVYLVKVKLVVGEVEPSVQLFQLRRGVPQPCVSSNPPP
jgi:hypothetical protein